MLRRFLNPPAASARTEPWTLRGLSPGRIENFSDCTFSFALTLLVIAVEVPKTYDDLLRILPGFFSFAACFAILSVLWLRHVVFFRRYGLSDTPTVALNTAFLALVLFYLYPLKFLMNSVFDALGAGVLKLRGGAGAGPEIAAHASLLPRVLPIYFLGFAAVALAFTLLFRHALRRREDLRLSPFEEVATRDDMILWSCATLAALLTAACYLWLPQDWAGVGALLLLAIPIARRVQRRRRRELARATG